MYSDSDSRSESGDERGSDGKEGYLTPSPVFASLSDVSMPLLINTPLLSLFTRRTGELSALQEENARLVSEAASTKAQLISAQRNTSALEQRIRNMVCCLLTKHGGARRIAV